LIPAVASLDPAPPAAVVAGWRDLASHGFTGLLLAGLLGEGLDQAYEADRADRAGRQHAVSPLVAASLCAAPLAEAVRQWMPAPATESPPTAT
jgi:hypothetical protein